LNAQLAGTVDGLAGDIGGAFKKEGDFNHLGYQFGLQLEIPLGNRAAAAIWQRSLMQRMQAIASYAGLVNQVALDVKTAARKVDESWEFLKKSRESRLHYQLLLDNIKSQTESGDQPLTFETVFLRLQYQQSLFQAQTTEDQALNDYNYAIASLEKAKGTILRYNNVMLEQEQLPFDMAVKGSKGPEQMLLGTTPEFVHAPVIPIGPPETGSAAK
jgi:outer membrane protein TolC